MVAARLPGPPELAEPPEVGGGDIFPEGGSVSVWSVIICSPVNELSGSCARATVGDWDNDLDREGVVVGALSASCRRRCSLVRARCSTVMARSWQMSRKRR